jgi:hypothetical protein
MTIARDAEKANGFAALNMLPSELAEAGKKQIEGDRSRSDRGARCAARMEPDYLDCARSGGDSASTSHPS